MDNVLRVLLGIGLMLFCFVAGAAEFRATIRYPMSLFDTPNDARLGAEWLATNNALMAMGNKLDVSASRLGLTPAQWLLAAQSFAYGQQLKVGELQACEESLQVGFCIDATAVVSANERAFIEHMNYMAKLGPEVFERVISVQTERAEQRAANGWPQVSATVSAVSDATRMLLELAGRQRQVEVATSPAQRTAEQLVDRPAPLATTVEAKARADKAVLALERFARTATVTTDVESRIRYQRQYLDHTAYVRANLAALKIELADVITGSSQMSPTRAHCGANNSQALAKTTVGKASFERYRSTHGGYVRPLDGVEGVEQALVWFDAPVKDGASANKRPGHRFGLCDSGRADAPVGQRVYWVWNDKPAWSDDHSELRCNPEASAVDCAAYGALWLLDGYRVNVEVTAQGRKKTCTLFRTEDLRHVDHWSFEESPLPDDTPAELRMPSFVAQGDMECRNGVQRDAIDTASAGRMRVEIKVVAPDA